MSESKIRFKEGDELTLFSKNLIPLISDINDRNKVISEHRFLNYKYNSLKYALTKINGKYYFIDSSTAVTEDSKISEDGQMTCPCCMGELTKRAGHLRGLKNGEIINVSGCFVHLKNETICAFKDSYNSNYTGEASDTSRITSYDHEYLKVTTHAMAKNKNLSFLMPSSYRVITSEDRAKVEFEFIEEKIIDAEMDFFIDISDFDEKNYVADILCICESGRRIIIEITCETGKTPREYYDRWNVMGYSVLELKMNDNKSFKDSELYYADLDELEVIASTRNFDDNRNYRYMYDSILEESRRQKRYIQTYINEKREEELLMRRINELKAEIDKLSYNHRKTRVEYEHLESQRDRLSLVVASLENKKYDLESKIEDLTFSGGERVSENIRAMKMEEVNMINKLDCLRSNIIDLECEYENKVAFDYFKRGNESILSREIAKLELYRYMLDIDMLDKSDTLNSFLDVSRNAILSKQASGVVLDVSTALMVILHTQSASIGGYSLDVRCKAKLIRYSDCLKLIIYDDVRVISLNLSSNADVSSIRGDFNGVLNLIFNTDSNSREAIVVAISIKEELSF